MSIQAMITGNLSKDAEAKISAAGKEYVQLVVRTGEPAQFIRTALFGDDCDGAIGLRKGDAVSVVGSLTVGLWESSGKASPSLSLMAHRVASPAIKKPRKPVQRRKPTQPTQQQIKAASDAQAVRDIKARYSLADDLPWGDE